MIKLDLSHAKLQEELSDYQAKVSEAHKWLHEKSGKGNDYVGWVEWPNNYDRDEVERISKAALRLKDSTDVLVVCGIGGSYLGARAAIEMINGLYPHKKTEIIFVGNTFSANYINQVIEHIKDKEICLNVISKSGTTTETSVSFRLFKALMEEKYHDKAKERVLATTDKERGTLKALADKEGYETFVIPDDIGGRYSVSTAVGLLAMAFAGIDPNEVLKGSKDAYDDFNTDDLNKNSAYRYAVARRILDNQGYSAEMFVTYDLQMTSVAEWWKQLFGESEGKEGKGILPTSACFSTDLHSLGQFMQDGSRIMFETVVDIKKAKQDILIKNALEDFDGLNFLAGKSMSQINRKALQGTLLAHVEGKVPSIIITLPQAEEYEYGYLVYFFEKACAISGYLLGVNPFDQPGVESYKNNMFALLNKPGYEKQAELLRKKL